MGQKKDGMAGFEITSAEAAPFATLKLLHPVSGEPTGIEIDLYGMDSDVYREHERRVTDRRLKRAAQRGSVKTKLSAAEIEAEGVELLVACTKAWRGLLEQGAPLECTSDNVRRLYKDVRLRWIRDAVNVFVGDREGFFAD